MPITNAVLASAAGLAALVLQAIAPAFAQDAAALSGEVSSAREGAMEGVVVSAKKDGSTITVSVVSDDKGHFSFPASRLDPGHYAISIRAVGYDLDGPKDATVAAGQEDKIGVKLKPARNLSAQLTNAEWLHQHARQRRSEAIPARMQQLPHLERIVRSTHDADEFMQVFQRMGGYYPGSTPLKPQRLVGDAVRDIGNGPKRAECGRMARRHQFEPAGHLELAAQDAAAADRQIHPRHHHRIRYAEQADRAARRGARSRGQRLVLGFRPDVPRRDGPEDRQGHAISDPGGQARLFARHARS